MGGHRGGGPDVPPAASRRRLLGPVHPPRQKNAVNTLLGRAARSTRLSAEARVTMLSASLASAAVLLMLVVVRRTDTVHAPVHLSWVVIALLSAISEVMVVHLESRR